MQVAAYFLVQSCYLIILLMPPPCNILPMADPWTHRKTLGSMPSCWHRIYTESGVVIVELFSSPCSNIDVGSRRKYVTWLSQPRNMVVQCTYFLRCMSPATLSINTAIISYCTLFIHRCSELQLPIGISAVSCYTSPKWRKLSSGACFFIYAWLNWSLNLSFV